ncbi:MAG: sugar ABC transporter ATP-binding protein [Sedimentisphaerales bacterium]|nr:sugar ABC transporter ATP-binding protein [Sedimentisphaerales bacterium]
MSAPARQTVLAARGICKRFPGVQALRSVDFELRAGEVHALVGENGAGKSTLSRIVVGLETPDNGSMELFGEDYLPRSKRQAEDRGIRMVMQELNLIGRLSVAENIFLDNLPSTGGFVRYGRLHAAAAAIMARVGLADVDPATPADALGIGQQQMVEIAAGLSRDCRVLILDEPTASLTDREIELLFIQIRNLREQGVAICYISHRMEEILRIADRITVLRDGRRIETLAAAETTIDAVIRCMVGRDVRQELMSREKPAGEVALRAEGLSRGAKVRQVSFELRRGEILGLAGLMGSGRTETLRALFAADPPAGGAVYLYGSNAPARLRHPGDAVRRGLAFCTEDRKQQGLLLPLPVRCNITLTRLREVSRWGWIRAADERAVAGQYVAALAVRCPSIEQPVGFLSGGNQQKVVIAKWLFCNCDILMFDEPTRGIDVGAKYEIYRLLARLADRGKAVLVVSSEWDELMAVCDRIAVMSDGYLVETFTPDRWSRQRILEAAYSQYLQPTARPSG